jgi:hypothetical protein
VPGSQVGNPITSQNESEPGIIDTYRSRVDRINIMSVVWATSQSYSPPGRRFNLTGPIPDVPNENESVPSSTEAAKPSILEGLIASLLMELHEEKPVDNSGQRAIFTAVFD